MKRIMLFMMLMLGTVSAVMAQGAVSFLCSFKDKVFHEMGHSLFLFVFITGSGIDGKAAIGYIRLIGSVNNAQPVR